MASLSVVYPVHAAEYALDTPKLSELHLSKPMGQTLEQGGKIHSIQEAAKSNQKFFQCVALVACTTSSKEFNR